MDVEPFRIPPGTTVDLSRHDPATTDGFNGDKEAGRVALEADNVRLAELQQVLYAQGRHRVLLVLQGMDTSGKDGTIRHVFRTINPLGVDVANFKRPSEAELARDYLWRAHAAVPRDGEIVIFNRSHYEDVLVVRVRGLVPEPTWRRRFGHIRDFERMLADEGTTVVKCFLHISRDEQRERLQERLDNPAKHWKFEHGDLEERRFWGEYQTAYAEALTETSTTYAPWYVVPSDRKWFRNLVVSRILLQTLERLDLAYPESTADLSGITIDP